MCACMFLHVHMCGGQRLNQMSSLVAFTLLTEQGLLPTLPQHLFPHCYPLSSSVSRACAHTHIRQAGSRGVQVQTHEGELGYQEGSQMQTDSPPEAQKE